MKAALQVLGVPVFTGDTGLEEIISNHPVRIVVTDETCRDQCLPRLIANAPSLRQAPVLTIPSGKKGLIVAETVLNGLVDAGADRNTLLIALGGGTVGDLCGFVASVYKRGMPILGVPTTLLSMSDSCIGGKTALDYRGVRNLIGTFSQPSAVVIDTGYLETLPPLALAEGHAEVVKHAILSGGALWEWAESTNTADIEWIITESLRVKKSFVEPDERDNSTRRALNFGHTVAHALEPHTELSHGAAVALGVLAESLLSMSKVGLSEERQRQIEQAMKRRSVCPGIDAIDPERIATTLMHDKKNAGGELKLSLVADIGEPRIDVSCEVTEVLTAIESLSQLCPAE